MSGGGVGSSDEVPVSAWSIPVRTAEAELAEAIAEFRGRQGTRALRWAEIREWLRLWALRRARSR